MGYTRFASSTTLPDALDGLDSLSAGLGAYPHDDVQTLAAPLDALIAEGDGLEAGLRRAQRTLRRANARVRTWDGVCDDRVREFNKDLLSAVRQDRAHVLFQAMFGGRSASEVIAMSLEPELEVIATVVTELGHKGAPAELRKQWLAPMQDALTQGRAAVAGRKAATEAVASAYEEIARWVERADRARRATDGKLTTWAAENNLASDFNDRFFPTTASAKSGTKPKGKKGGEEPDPTDPPTK